jgi:hypothetical protein
LKQTITKKKKTGGVAQVVEHLPSKPEALRSNPQYCQRETERERERERERDIQWSG